MTERTTSLGGGRCLIVGEVGVAHDGSLGFAHAFIDAIAAAGADAVKFQTHIAAAESTLAEPFRVEFSRQDASRYEYWRRMEFTEDQWRGLANHARARDMLFLSSPFSLEAVELLVRVGMPMWKIASGETSNVALLDRVLETGRPVLLSTGMSSQTEIDAAVGRVQARGVSLAVLQSTTAYPCPPERVGLNLVPFFRQRFGCHVGLSDHSGTIFPGLAGAAVGLDVLEVHVALSREMFGPDVPASVTIAELRQLVQGVRFIERMRSSPVDKDVAVGEMAAVREIFTKSVVARTNLAAGTVLREELMAAKKPGNGIPAGKLKDLVGRRLRRAIAADDLIQEKDIEELAR